MPKISKIDMSTDSFVIDGSLSIRSVRRKPGKPERLPGMTLGIIEMENDPPHGGEMHPDGDELLCVLKGRVRVECDSAPGDPTELGPGDACIIPQGEWHQVRILEPVQLLHVTPGPRGDHRPPDESRAGE